jgi:hypothetical protein
MSTWAGASDSVFAHCPKSLRGLILERVRVMDEHDGERLSRATGSHTVGMIVFGDAMCIRYINPYAQSLLMNPEDGSRARDGDIGMDVANLVAQLRERTPEKLVSHITASTEGVKSAQTRHEAFRMRALHLDSRKKSAQAPVLVLIEPYRDQNPPPSQGSLPSLAGYQAWKEPDIREDRA